jgi:hypothetical protein
MLKNILPDFQAFLISRKLADEKHAPFFALWVYKFLAFSKGHEGLDFPQCIPFVYFVCFVVIYLV